MNCGGKNCGDRNDAAAVVAIGSVVVSNRCCGGRGSRANWGNKVVVVVAAGDVLVLYCGDRYVVAVATDSNRGGVVVVERNTIV